MLDLAQLRDIYLADVNDQLDVEGRPIGEIRASRLTFEKVKTNYSACPYPGSRSKGLRLINQSALEPLIQTWRSSFGALSYIESLCREAGTGSCLLEKTRIAAVALTLPSYLIYRRSTTFAQAPLWLASLHKLCAGIFGLFKNRLLEQAAVGDVRSFCDSKEQILDFAERTGAFLSRTGIEACAGPPGLISSAMDILFTSKAPKATDYGPVRAAIDDPTEFLKYANASIDMSIWLNAFGARCLEIEKHFSSCEVKQEVNGAGAMFSDRTLRDLRHLDAPSLRQYALGAASLLPSRYASSALNMVGTLEDYVQLGYLEPRSRLKVLLVNSASSEFEGLKIFFDLHSRIHEALGMTTFGWSDVRNRVEDIFGLLPTSYIVSRLVFEPDV